MFWSDDCDMINGNQGQIMGFWTVGPNELSVFYQNHLTQSVPFFLFHLNSHCFAFFTAIYLMPSKMTSNSQLFGELWLH